MPELPEVETIVRWLRSGSDGNPGLPGSVVKDAILLWERTLAEPSPDEFTRRIAGQQVVSLGRRGKYIRVYLDQDELLIHLRMSGDLVVESSALPYADHLRMLINLNDGRRLSFIDARKFGRVWLTDSPEEVLGSLGLEPLESAFTPGLFADMLSSRKRQLKPLLLDQRFIAGIGNIYADEALHRARLHPLTISNTLTVEEVQRLYTGIRDALQDGIDTNGASIDWVYRGGEFQNYFRVYGRTGEACLVCGAKIERIVVGQRSTHYCPVCQPLSALP